MAVVRRVDGADDLVDLVERVPAGEVVSVHPLHFVPDVIGHSELTSQPVDLDRLVGDPVAAASVPRGGDTALGLERCVELTRVLAHRPQRVARDRVGDLARRVPRRTRRQLGLLDQHRVGPALVGEVVQQAGAGDAASHDDHARGIGECHWSLDQ